MAKHISVVFPGQGSQSIGMLDQFSHEDILSSGYDSNIFNFDLLDIISSNEEKLNRSHFTQPALVLTSHLYFRKLTKLLSTKLDLLAGHSLGEYSALLAAGSIELDAALQLVYKRGLFMSEAPSGSMLAVMGLEISVIDKICNDISNEGNIFVAPANINTPNQIVIGGDHKAIDIASIKLKEEGAKRCIKLKVSTASHCLLMKESALKLQKELENIDIIKPTIGVVQNVDARLAETPEFIKNNLISQLTSPVQWVDTMKRVDSNKGILIECGPGKVLSGLAKQNGIENILTMSSQNFEEDLRNML
ncbi:MAG: ACP S-malonyltransferase [SAR86 cluster bacterium]|jgi:[acyl-carrier-protein] S-malonyltransferase|nr:ACP S-malonyltransferase [SAR86 cluster bacterium]MDG1949142.1 ACP S-malonyltransferase [SAR86 cluster bacterium]MDG2092713.1 ACP S-malonyltransferase [SAR86 cluster bacterium]|tara:strand:- start:16512 stop:17426 length:915 start_codon:yes stop_codon:yes gene_type:complete